MTGVNVQSWSVFLTPLNLKDRIRLERMGRVRHCETTTNAVNMCDEQ